jgi:serine/threonine protein kinase
MPKIHGSKTVNYQNNFLILTFILHMVNTPLFTSYTILHQIGLGGMATVYLAEHKTLGHQVAIKVLNKEFTFNQNIRSRFVEEAKKMVRMNHPNVVKVTDLIDEENTVAIVMEYVEGKTLAELSLDHKFSDSEIELYLKQMLQALSYIHKQGLIHRDIKPSNFILGQDGNLKLTDFGISKSFLSNNEHTQTSTSMSLGTPMYMSPEQVRSTKDVTHLTDIYSLGVVLWQLVSGQKPYNSETTSAFDLQLKIVQEDLPLTHSYWDKIIQKATQKDETNRFQSADEFLLALDNKEVVEDDFEKTVFVEKVVFPKNERKNVKKNQQKRGKAEWIFIFATICILLLNVIFLFYEIQENKNIAEKEQQKEIDSLKVVAEQKTLELEEKEKKKEVVKVTPPVSSSKLVIGQKHAGGIIFYIDETGKHGKVCSEQNLGQMIWEEAIKKCQNFSAGVFSDWYLPNIDELKLLYKSKNKIGNFADYSYWSSTEYGGDAAWFFDFGFGVAFTSNKVNPYYVRAVRAF